jgi:hypothetical protein
MKWAWHRSRIEERNAMIFWRECQKDRNHYEDLDIGMMVILK